MPDANLFGEPCGRDTAAAVGMAAAMLNRRDPDGTMGIFTADHIISPLEKFRAAVERAYAVAEQHADALITFGIKPTHPHTGLGYIHRGDEIDTGVYEVQQFKEKPDAATAQQYVESGEFYWNSGMFVWRIAAILAELEKNLPESHAKLMQIADAWDTLRGKQSAAEIYPTLQKISIDFAVMEKAQRVIVVEMDCDWLDVGSWPALADVVAPDDAGNTRAAANTAVLDADGNILVSESDHLIAAIGVKDLIVVHAADATLVCRKQDAQRIKELVEQLKSQHGDRYA
jgi:mannose-1-phosphate guanylyltransferase